MSDLTSASIRVPRTFDWNNREAAKTEYDEMYAILRQCLGEKCWILDEAQTAVFLPTALPQPPGDDANAKTRNKWLGLKEKYDEKILVVYKAFYYGHAVLRCLFPYPSMVRRDVDVALDTRPTDVDATEWTAITSFRAAITKIKSNYSRQTVTDNDTLRRDLQNLTDEVAGGFHEYQREFIRILCQLRASNANIVTDAELREWVKKGIKNKEIFNAVTGQLYMNEPEVAYDRVFERVSTWLQLAALNGSDPYGVINSSRGSVSAANAASRFKPNFNNSSSTIGGSGNHRLSRGDNFPSGDAFPSRGGNFDLCTRCWTPGHFFRVCTSFECAVCKKSLARSDSTCPGWRDHHSAKFRFTNDIPPWERKKAFKRSGDSFQEGASKRVVLDLPYESNQATGGQSNTKATGHGQSKGAKKRARALKSAIKKAAMSDEAA
jgi:hypothetical protein